MNRKKLNHQYTKLLTQLSTNLFLVVLFICFFLVQNTPIWAQNIADAPIEKKDSTQVVAAPKPSKNNSDDFRLESKIKRTADDSVIVNYRLRKAYLYGNAKVEYDNIVLEAAYIEIDFANNSVYAAGLPDSNGVMQGEPVFKEGSDEYKTKVLKYNFQSRKAMVYNVMRQEGEAYVFLEEGKKMPDNTTYVNHGHFSTCSLEHPHYSVKYTKGKVIPGDKIVTGPIYMEIEGIPLPLVLPFGFFPNKKGRSNGILIPSYGYTENRGYYLSNGGYYRGLGEHMDLAIRGDIYSRGSWAVKGLSNYNYRYRFNGSLGIDYAVNKTGETDTKNFSEDRSFFIRWRHSQDAKANPYSNFSANVNFGSTQYNKLNSFNTNDYLTNTFQSSIAYTARIKQKYNLTVNLNHSQNTQTHIMNLDLPTLSFSTPRFNPFQRKVAVGPKKWYEKINMSYTVNAKNQLVAADSLLLDSKFSDFNNGIKHNIPMTINIPVGKVVWNNSLNLNEYWYFNKISKYYDPNLISGSDTGGVVVDKNTAFNAMHDISISSNINTRIYGMYKFLWGPMTAMRHVMTPTIGFTYHPDVSTAFNYYNEFIDGNGDTLRYSIAEGGIFNVPVDGKSGAVTLNIANTLEAKVKSKKDTITGLKKIKLIEAFNISTRYDLAKEEFKLSPLAVTARTTLFKQIRINFTGSWDFYARDSVGTRINEFNWNVNKKLLSKNSSNIRLSTSYSFSANDLKKKSNTKLESDKGSPEQLKELNSNYDHYIDFNNPWRLSVDYSYVIADMYNTSTQLIDRNFTHTLGLSGDVNVSRKWKVGFRTGYDFIQKKVTITSIDVYRDLHCWELMFNWIPTGYRKSYNLTIRVKSPLLQDLKITKKRDWRD